MEIGELIEIKEGITRILVPNLERYKVGKKIEPAHAPVFYNPAMEINRSISVIALEAYSRLYNYDNIVICEPLSGTGIRGLRYMLEVSSVSRVIMNDIDIKAYNLIKLNVNRLGVDDRVEVHNKDASQLLLEIKDKHVDVIDVDPFGSPIGFIDPALRCIRNRGLLCVTATDVGVLMGRYPHKCIRRYGAKPLYATPISREIGLRILIGSIARIALQHDYGITPLLSYYEGHYYRIFMIVSKDRSDARKTVTNLGYFAYDRETLNRKIVKSYPTYCTVSNRRYELCGPLWIGYLIDIDFVKEMYNILNTEKQYLKVNTKLDKLVELFVEEAQFSCNIYYSINEICKGFDREISISDLIQYSKSIGIDVVRTHIDNRGVRSFEEFQTLRELVRLVLSRS